MRFFQFILVWFFCVESVMAQQGGGSPGDMALKVDWAERYEAKTTLDPYEDDLLEDSIDPQTGRLTFATIDVALPGNSQLEVAIRRELSPSEFKNNEFANWKLVFPVNKTKVFGRGTGTKIYLNHPLGRARLILFLTLRR